MARTTDKASLPKVYDYRKFSSYFSDYMAQRSLQDDKFSYRWLAKKLGLASPSRLSMLASGRRLPNEDFIETLLAALDLSEEEVAYCHLMVLHEKSKNLDRRAYYLEKMDKLRPPDQRRVLEESEFSLYETWYLPIILEMVVLEDFDASPSAIAERLAGKITADEAADALAALERNGLIKTNAAGQIERQFDWTQTGRFSHSETITRFHEAMAEKSREAIRETVPANRYLSGITLPIDPEKIPEARRLFLNLERQLLELLESGNKTEVYFLHMHLFPLTRS